MKEIQKAKVWREKTGFEAEKNELEAIYVFK